MEIVALTLAMETGNENYRIDTGDGNCCIDTGGGNWRWKLAVETGDGNYRIGIVEKIIKFD